MKHSNDGASCPSCEVKLKDAHPDLASWFWEFVKPKYQDCHIAWSFRDKENQEAAFLDGKTKLHFPLSAHNKCDEQGNPCALALDLFKLDQSGIGVWPWAYFKSIAEMKETAFASILWGGHWKTLGDADHFELKPGHVSVAGN